MKKTKEILSEEQKFLRLCGQVYKDKIKKKRQMTLNDFNRFVCVLMTLQMENYVTYFCVKLFPELLNQVVDESERKRKQEDIFYSAEDNAYVYLEQHQRWLKEFFEQMPLVSQKRKYSKLFGLYEEIIK